MNKKILASVIGTAIIGAGGLSLIKTSEGLRYSSYSDPVGIPTICYGHTGPEVRLGQRVTPATCDALLLQDIAAHQRVLIGPKNCIAGAKLNQNQLDAVTSLTFNIGTGKFCASTMAKRLAVQDYIGAAQEFPKWVNATANGKRVQLPGLIKRRTAEQRLFLTAGPALARSAPTAPIRALAGKLY